MKFNPSVCPECGSDIKGTVDMVPGLALVYREGDGEYEFSGQTDICWDGQTSEYDDKGQVRVECERGHEFFAVQDDS